MTSKASTLPGNNRAVSGSVDGSSADAETVARSVSQKQAGPRIPTAKTSEERIADILIALERGDAATFRLDARAERNLHQIEHRGVVRMVLDDWCWFLTVEEAGLVALALRLDCDVIGSAAMPAHKRLQVTKLVADAFEAAGREADALAAARNAAGPGDPVPLFLDRAAIAEVGS